MKGNSNMKVRTLAIAAVMALVGVRAEAAAPADVQGGTWKIVYSSAEGPEGRALEVLTECIGFHLLRERHLAIPMVLPIEQDGGEPVKGKRDMIVIGRDGLHREDRSLDRDPVGELRRLSVLGRTGPDRRAGQRVLREDPRAHAVRRLRLEGAAVPRLEELDRAGRDVHARMRRGEDAGVPPVDHEADAMAV